MNKKLKFVSLLLFILSISLTVSANVKVSGDGVWKEIDDSALKRKPVERLVEPSVYRTFRLDKAVLQTLLDKAPQEFSNSRAGQTILTLPMPDGTFSRFDVQESSIMEAPLAAKYSNIKTYIAHSLDNPADTARISFSPSGFRAMVLSNRGTVLVDPYFFGDTENYISYAKADAPKTSQFICQFDNQLSFVGENYIDALGLGNDGNSVISGTNLRTYRLALAATGEYTNVFRQSGDTDAQAKARALEQQVIIMNRVNGVYEKDVAIRMVLIANNDTIIYTDPNTDPYTNDDGDAMLGQNQTNINTVIGTANYDVGHVFSTGGGGVAVLNGPCGASKARGVTGLLNPVGDAFSIDFVAHEMGHQFGANHTFNTSCGGNRSGGSAYETGSGITIMGYAGVCGAQDLALHSIDTFHVKSIEVIVAYTTTGNGNTCAVTTSTGNTPPTVSAVGGTTFNIPKGTPFKLTATGSDTNGDTITYDWQEYDLGSATSAIPNTDSDNVARPIFRPYLPNTTGIRYFPDMQYVLNNANVPPSTYNCGRSTACLTGELLPAITRTMNFQVIARDNRANGGGINTASAQVIVDGNSGPFTVTSPNTPVTVAASDASNTVTWNVANTTAAPVNAANVRILASVDGGQTFPYVLAGNAPNNGTAQVFLPLVNTNTARIKIESVNGIFFDVSNTNFTIVAQPFLPNASRFDFDGDGKDDISVFRNGAWYVQRSTSGFLGVQYGLANDRTVAADYDGDAKTDVAVFRDGVWYVLKSSTNTTSILQWGSAGDVPVPGDYDGDGKADYAVFRAGVWYIYNGATGAVRIQQFGLTGDKPVVGDFDGDLKQDLAIFRNGEWYIQGSSLGFFSFQFGSAGDIPQPEDYDGDAKADAAVFRNGTWYVLGTTMGFRQIQWGSAGDIPAAADYNGDGKADYTVFRPSDGNWYMLRPDIGVSVVPFGLSGDKPIAAQSN